MSLATKLVHPDSFYKNLNGLFCLYKPPDMNLVEVMDDLKFCLVKGTNQLFNNKQKKYVKVDENQIVLADDLSDRIESSGYRYVRKDFKLDFLHPISEQNSGIVIGTLNTDKGLKLVKNPILKGYQIKGRLGILTNDNTSQGNLIDRATYGHINRSKIDRTMSTIQSVYQREILRNPTNVLGISAETYEEASKGIVIPKTTKTPPQIYDIKCIEFDKPFFKIELQTINESENFLINLIHTIGLKLRTYAVCVQIRRIKYGPIDLNSECLLQNEWKNFDKFYQNLIKTNKIFEKKNLI